VSGLEATRRELAYKADVHRGPRRQGSVIGGRVITLPNVGRPIRSATEAVTRADSLRNIQPARLKVQPIEA
jgi:hypothetical protein